jgi:hypothetical protein
MFEMSYISAGEREIAVSLTVDVLAIEARPSLTHAARPGRN